jgi:F-type H+-transporting ATPase subunit delta
MAALGFSCAAVRATRAECSANFMARGRSALNAKVGAAKGRGFRMVTQAKGNAVACGYAAALVEACQNEGALDSVHADMETLDAYVKANEAVAGFLANPTMEDGKKKDILTKLGKEAGFHPFTSNFLNLLVDKKRIGYVEDIAEEFEVLYCENTDTQVATVTSAVKLENEQQFMIAKKLQEMTGAKNIKLKPEVDASLLGGFVVTYGKDGSGFIDMSVKGQVQKLQSEIVIA